jgi:putative transferase (TIGR04331 family)
MKSFNYVNQKNYKFFLYSTYLGLKNEIRLSLKKKQLPIFLIKDNKSTTKKIDLSIRQKLSGLGSKENIFEKHLVKFLGMTFPKIFLENYLDLEIFSKTSNIPQSPKIIFTSNSLWYDTKISYHVANLIEKKKIKTCSRPTWRRHGFS